MLKTLIFALLLALPLADFTPKWKSCSDPSDSWHPTSVTLVNPPAHGQNDTAFICGESVDAFELIEYDYKVKLLDIVIYSGVHKLNPPMNISQGESACYTFGIGIPNFVIGTVSATFTPIDSDNNERGCVEVDVTV